MKVCEILLSCEFFQKYKFDKDPLLEDFFLKYCRGTQMDGCARKQYRRLHGCPPAHDLMPDGGQKFLGTVRLFAR